MDNDCFNTVVRMLACDEGVLFTDPPIHYMDLRFCVTYRNSSFYVPLVSTCFNNIPLYLVHDARVNTRSEVL
mgnify:CR=1 FL=1